jgi:Flp pilus assembly protein protease CpaA
MALEGAMVSIGFIPTVAVVLVGVIASITDIWKYKVSNLLTIPLFLSGIIFHAFVSGWSGLGFSLGGALFGFGVLIFCYALGGVGAGDVKFVAGIGAWLGLLTTAQVFLVAGLLIGALSLVLITLRDGRQGLRVHLLVLGYQARCLGRSLGAEERVEEVAKRDDRRKRLIPLAAMMTIGLMAILGLRYFCGLDLFGILWQSV